MLKKVSFIDRCAQIQILGDIRGWELNYYFPHRMPKSEVRHIIKEMDALREALIRILQ